MRSVLQPIRIVGPVRIDTSTDVKSLHRLSSTICRGSRVEDLQSWRDKCTRGNASSPIQDERLVQHLIGGRVEDLGFRVSGVGFRGQGLQDGSSVH